MQYLSLYGIVVLALHDTLVQESIELLPTYPLRAANALKFATALSVSRAVSQQTFYVVSADKEIGEACAAHHLSVLDPEHPSALGQLRALR